MDADVEAGSSTEDDVRRLHARIEQAASEIRALFREDLPEFFEREVKKRFLEAPDFAAGLSKGKLAALKADARERARDVTEAVDAALADSQLWVLPEPPEDARGSITEHEPAWRTVKQVDSAVEALLSHWSFPASPDGYGVSYEPPARFIGGKHLKTLSEHLWRALHELARLKRSADQQRQSRLKADLAKRWEEA